MAAMFHAGRGSNSQISPRQPLLASACRPAREGSGLGSGPQPQRPYVSLPGTTSFAETYQPDAAGSQGATTHRPPGYPEFFVAAPRPDGLWAINRTRNRPGAGATQLTPRLDLQPGRHHVPWMNTIHPSIP